MAARVGKPRQAPKSAPVRTPAAPATIGDNSAYREEEERIQLISFVGKLSKAEELIEQAKAPLKAAQAARSQIVNLAKAAGFTGKELAARMEEMNNPARDNPQRIERETRHRRWLGIIQPEQTEMQLADKAPQEAKDEAHWAAEGYKAGLRQKSSSPPTECPERFVQAFMKAHEAGLKVYLEANVPGANRIREQAAADFAKDEPEIDVEAAARKLKNDPAFMARSAPDEVLEVAQSASIPEAGSTTSGPDDGFEATEEELAAQTGRPVHDEEVV